MNGGDVIASLKNVWELGYEGFFLGNKLVWNDVCFVFFSICSLVRTLERLLCSYSSSPHDAGVSCGVPELLNMYSNSAYSVFSL